MFRFVLTLVWYLAYFPSLITKIIQIYHVILKNATQNTTRMRQFHLAIYKRGVEFIATELGRAKGKPSNSAGLQIRCADNSLTIQAAQYL